MKRVGNSSTGFTLLEVTLAVAILSMSLVTLLGLQASIVQQTVRDRQRQSAMLMARRILAVIEVTEESPMPGERSGKAGDILTEVGFPPNPGDDDPALQLPTTLKVENWNLPGIDQANLMMKITLIVSFGDSQLDTFEAVYFLPFDEILKDEL